MNDKKNSSKKEVEFKELAVVTTKAELKEYLNLIKDKLASNQIAPVYALSAVNSVMSDKTAHDLFDNANIELAKEIWLKLKKSGFQLDNPPMLFS
jgi:hypothetical protein